MIEFAACSPADDTMARHLAPALNHAQAVGLLDTWWYIRKPPGLRVRYRSHEPELAEDLLATLAAQGHISGWARGIYEPETLAFGGPAAMETAHDLFHHDARHFLTRAARGGSAAALGQRETSVLLFSAMLRAAGLDWFEYGDVWAKIGELRPASHTLTAERSTRLGRAMQRLMTIDPRTTSDLICTSWMLAFTMTGGVLLDLAMTGCLRRGLRAVLAHHFIFHANRAGLSAADQATLAALATATVFHSQEPGFTGNRIQHQ
ncbi:thiopeptide-type bacteriocin biosynthesis protein [Spongiactinospora sp. TRM90649]|uniref:thiopeptide-type bacteriocin biosynthesis protein n=1 Tax=Spongiactinospora sp. TRM90649 TaxID=3031114 RepID=UPI0023F8E8CD|nr:thiopeptide-type bacteriocin biosynthesis protein [Spongiactinospora sp. TRM90649]MDF5758820.1 thiopeptide-type bacteriocin biosynthesis protein [Spongiactinospora sp. TRM90649]